MKRRGLWFWFAGGLALLACAVLLVAPSLPAPSPYRFLEGHRQDEQQLSEKDWATVASMHPGLTLRFYTWQGDYHTLRAKAEGELFASGCREMLPRLRSSTPYSGYLKGDPAALGLTPTTLSRAAAGGASVVEIYGDTKFSHDFYLGPKPPSQDKGWVTVIVMSTQSPGLFERFRNWVGF